MTEDESEPVNAMNRRAVNELVDELSQFVFDLIKRANNIERQAGKQEDLYYRLHGELKVVKDSVRSLKN